MRKSDLHPSLQQTCVPVFGKGGCYAVVPPPVPMQVDAPSCHVLFVLAARELEVLRETIARHPDMADLLLAMLNRREAVDSSQIEGTHTGFDGLLLHEIEQGNPDGVSASADADAQETFAYVRAYMAGRADVERDGVRALGRELISTLHRVLMADQPRATPGELRTVQNYIGMPPEMARFIPPPPDRVPALLDDLVRLLQYEPEGVMQVSVLMRAAIAHAQFETIHPFLDGNGRTGRLLLPLMFMAAGEPAIHLATFLKVRQRDYYDALLEVQMRLNWEPWLRLFLECVIASARHTVQLFAVLASIRERWRSMLTERKKRRHATIWRAVAVLLGQPIITVGELARRLETAFPAANGAIEELVEMDILRPTNDRRRNRVYAAHEVLNALYTGLDAVLADAGRAGRG
ncbi:MAG: Fic family protein [Rhodocyclales bacterium]|nr:Fic family protein [Rhodocyclales bacterium]